MSIIIVEFTEDQKEKILNLVNGYLNEYQAWGGEMVSQDDKAQADAILLCCEIADIVSHDFFEDDED